DAGRADHHLGDVLDRPGDVRVVALGPHGALARPHLRRIASHARESKPGKAARPSNRAGMARSRTLIAAAVAAGALVLAGAVALGAAPGATDGAASVSAWFRDHHDAARLYAWTATFGALGFSVAAGIIRGLLPAPSRDVFLLGAAAFVAETSVQAWF